MSWHDDRLLDGDAEGNAEYPSNDDGAREAYFDEHHIACEACRETLCPEEMEACEGGCCSDYLAPGFMYDGLAFCDGACSDDARATLAEDFANQDRKARNAFAFEDAAMIDRRKDDRR